MSLNTRGLLQVTSLWIFMLLAFASCREEGANKNVPAAKPEKYQITSENSFSLGRDTRMTNFKKATDGNYLFFAKVKPDSGSYQERHYGIDYLIKLSADGALLDTSRIVLEYPPSDYVELPDCFYVVTTDFRTMGGYTTNTLSKYDQHGKIRWAKKCDRPKYPDGNALLVLTDEKDLLLVSDEDVRNKNSNRQVLSIRKYNLQGEIISAQFYAKHKTNNPVAIIKTYDHNFLLTAETRAGKKTNLWLIKLHQNGDTIWTKEYADFYPQQTLQLKDSSLLFYGGDYYYPTANSGSCHFLKIIKTDQHGNLLWEKSIKEHYYESTGTVVETSGGGCLFSSVVVPILDKGEHTYLFELDKNGNRIFERKYAYSAGLSNAPILVQGDQGVIMYTRKWMEKPGEPSRYGILISKLAP